MDRGEDGLGLIPGENVSVAAADKMRTVFREKQVVDGLRIQLEVVLFDVACATAGPEGQSFVAPTQLTGNGLVFLKPMAGRMKSFAHEWRPLSTNALAASGPIQPLFTVKMKPLQVS